MCFQILYGPCSFCCGNYPNVNYYGLYHFSNATSTVLLVDITKPCWGLSGKMEAGAVVVWGGLRVPTSFPRHKSVLRCPQAERSRPSSLPEGSSTACLRFCGTRPCLAWGESGVGCARELCPGACEWAGSLLLSVGCPVWGQGGPAGAWRLYTHISVSPISFPLLVHSCSVARCL